MPSQAHLQTLPVILGIKLILILKSHIHSSHKATRVHKQAQFRTWDGRVRRPTQAQVLLSLLWGAEDRPQGPACSREALNHRATPQTWKCSFIHMWPLLLSKSLKALAFFIRKEKLRALKQLTGKNYTTSRMRAWYYCQWHTSSYP